MTERYQVRLASRAKRDLNSVPPRIVPAVIEFIYSDLSRHPQRVGKPLRRELSGFYSARRGPYRVLYRIVDDQLVVLVVQIEHRADVYRTR